MYFGSDTLNLKEYKRRLKIKKYITIGGICLLLVVIGIGVHAYRKRDIQNQEIQKLLSVEDQSKQGNNYVLLSDYQNSSKDKKIEKKDIISEVNNNIKNQDKDINYPESNDVNNNGAVSSLELNYSKDDIDLLARLINSEAGNQPYMGKLAVGNVVIYRSQIKGCSIHDVVFQSGQFDGVTTEKFTDNYSEECKKAAIEVLQGRQATKGAFYFANLNLCSPGWAKKEKFIARIGDHWFFRK